MRPRTVLERLQGLVHATGINDLLCVFSFGDMAPEHAMRSLRLFAEQVGPTLSLDRVR